MQKGIISCIDHILIKHKIIQSDLNFILISYVICFQGVLVSNWSFLLSVYFFIAKNPQSFVRPYAIVDMVSPAL